MLAAMFSGRHHLVKDKDGRYFIDRNGKHFVYVLDFIRHADLPPAALAKQVYKEAQFYGIEKLKSCLEGMQPIIGEQFRQKFIDYIPNYRDNVDSMITLAVGRADEVLARFRYGMIRICICTQKQDRIPFTRCKIEKKADFYFDVSEQEWSAEELVQCIARDVEEKGYEIDYTLQECICGWCIPGKSLYDFPPVIELNVGGAHHTTSLRTLRKYEDSMLAAMFSGRHNLTRDKEGRYFVDRNGTHFGYILDFLRNEDLPPAELSPEIFKEARYFGIDALCNLLRDVPPLFGEHTGRQEFIARLPEYQENVEKLIQTARESAVAARESKAVVCVYKADSNLDADNLHTCRYQWCASFGPWNATPGINDLLDSITVDLKDRRYNVEYARKGECGIQLGELSWQSCPKQFYEFTFKWW
ncbi:KCTD7 [Branchiostoma lanceolatum]|uniref:KCTD7 protein n=1 Tax=Branchiostoma lanceolatum TaxID=7740 RepID=A0A8J9YJN5_BRALA|nr:KCTD7 [Branchiostoma lanceolatum]